MLEKILFCSVALKEFRLPVLFGLVVSSMVGTQKISHSTAAEMDLNFTCNSSVLWAWASD